MVVALSLTSAAHADPSNVLVFPFENLTNDRTLDWIGEGIAELIIGRLQSDPALDVFSREDRLTAFEKLSIPETAILSRATILKLGLDNGADHVITGSFSGTGEDFQIVARIIDMEAGASTDFKAGGKLQDVVSLTTTVTWHLLKRIVPGTTSPEADYTARPPTPRSALENYIRGILNPDLLKRIDLLQNAVRLYPQYAPALFQLGRAYHLASEFAMSNQWLEKLPTSTPERQQVLFMMGLNYFNMNDYDDALMKFQALPETHDVLLNLGAVFARKGDGTSALSAWRRAAGVDPLSSDVSFNQGYLSFRQGDFQQAEKHLLGSLRLRGRDSEAMFLLGRTYERLGRIEDARRLIAQASRLSQRVERWQNQPIPELERFVTSTTFRGHDEVWTVKRLSRRTASQDLTSWLDLVQAYVDTYLFGEALRELHDVLMVFPDSSEARSLSTEVDRLRNVR